MAHYIPLSRAARLVGVSRNTLQNKIRAGELSTFEGEIEIDELLRAYPQTKLEDSTLLERAQRIIDYALTKPGPQSLPIPDADTLLTRISRISSELAQATATVQQQSQLLKNIRQQLEYHIKHPHPQRFEAFYQWFEQTLQQPQPLTEAYHPLIAKNTLLQVMTAEVTLLPSRHECLLEGRETLLEAILQAGYNPPYGCHDGRCGRCKARLVSGRTKVIRHTQTNTITEEGYIELCRHTAVTNVTLEVPEITQGSAIPEQHLSMQCERIQQPTPAMLLVKLASTNHQRLQYLAGQAVTLHISAADTIIKTVAPIASCPCDERYLQFHLPAKSAFAQALQQHPQAAITLHNPQGDFILHDTDPLQPLIFIAVENSFAPIKSLLQQALTRDIPEAIHFYWIAQTPQGHYEDNICRAWQDALDNFHYTPLVASPEQGFEQILSRYPTLAQHTLYMAASAPMVNKARQLLQAHADTDALLYLYPVNDD